MNPAFGVRLEGVVGQLYSGFTRRRVEVELGGLLAGRRPEGLIANRAR